MRSKLQVILALLSIIFICQPVMAIAVQPNERSVWKLSIGDTLEYEGWLRWGEDNELYLEELWSPIIRIGEKANTTWGTERLWINGTISTNYVEIYTAANPDISQQEKAEMQANYSKFLCLDSVAGAVLTNTNATLLTSSNYTSFDPILSIAMLSPDAYIIPIANPSFSWAPNLTTTTFDPWPMSALQNETSTGEVDNSAYYIEGDYRIPAIKVSFTQEGDIVPGSFPSPDDRFTTYKNQFISWYSSEWGVLLKHEYKKRLLEDNLITQEYHVLANSSLEISRELVPESEGATIEWFYTLGGLGLILIHRSISKKSQNRRLMT